MQVTAKGFKEYVQDGILLSVNETASVSPHLTVGSEIEVVQVKSDAELIEPSVTSMGKVVGQRELGRPAAERAQLFAVGIAAAWRSADNPGVSGGRRRTA